MDEPASEQEIASAWPTHTPPRELVEAWRTCRRARLFEDVDFGQWGLVLLSPRESTQRTAEELARRPDVFLDSDVVAGEFLGDQDLLVFADSEACDSRVLVDSSARRARSLVSSRERQPRQLPHGLPGRSGRQVLGSEFLGSAFRGERQQDVTDALARTPCARALPPRARPSATRSSTNPDHPGLPDGKDTVTLEESPNLVQSVLPSGIGR